MAHPAAPGQTPNILAKPADLDLWALLDHFIGATPAAASVMDRNKMNPGFSGAGFLKRDATLQAKLNDLIKKTPAFARLRIALVDLTADRNAPKYAGHKDMEQGTIASTGKIAVMYTAHQLKFDLKVFAKRNPTLQTAGDLFYALRSEWAQSQVFDPQAPETPLFTGGPQLTLQKRLVKKDGKPVKVPLGGPKLETIFDVQPSGAGLSIAFKAIPNPDDAIKTYLTKGKHTKERARNMDFAERMHLMIDDSDNACTHTCVQDIGFAYIASCLWQSGLYNPSLGGGLWLGGSYGGTVWSSPPSPEKPKAKQAATAGALAAFMTLLAQKRLVNEPASLEMLKLLNKQGSRTRSFFDEGLAFKNPRLEFDKKTSGRPENVRFHGIQVFSKLGILNDVYDCTLIRRERAAGGPLRYAAIGLDSPDEESLWKLIVQLDALVDQTNP